MTDWKLRLTGRQITIYRENRGYDRDIIKKRIHYTALSDFKPLKDEDGVHCLNCGKILGGRKRKYCSDECSNVFFAKHNWNAMSARIMRKQNHTCQKCGATPHRNENGYFDWKMDHSKFDVYDYVVDHIVPIALGGAEFDETNLQVLCGLCNKEKTRNDQKEIAKKRHEIAFIINPFNVGLADLERPRQTNICIYCG